jgi:Mn-containing catalase
MRTMMQYLFQSINFRGDATSKPYKDLLQGVGNEQISHVELIGTTISRLLDGSPDYNGKKTDCSTTSCWSRPGGCRSAGSMR